MHKIKGITVCYGNGECNFYFVGKVIAGKTIATIMEFSHNDAGLPMNGYRCFDDTGARILDIINIPVEVQYV